MFFSTNTMDDKKNEIKTLWQARETTSLEKYLGLSTPVGKNKKAAFSEIKRKVWQKLQGWKEKVLSQGGGKYS